MNRLISTVMSFGMTLGLTVGLPGSAPSPPGTPLAGPLASPLPNPGPYTTLLDLHPVANGYAAVPKAAGSTMPKIVRQGVSTIPDPRQIEVPTVVQPVPPEGADPMAGIGKAGTGFFIGTDGSLLTAAHVVNGCRRMQVISKFVPRSWVSLVAADPERDIALLRATEYRPNAVARVSASAPASNRLLVLGYPDAAGLIAASETWAVTENQKFPASVGPLANPKEMLWLSAPDITHGYSGGPIFDPKLGGVVGMVKGEVDGGYLRLVRDLPTTGMAIGPGVGQIGPFLKREAPYASMTLIAATGETGQDTLRRATVHVLCWH